MYILLAILSGAALVVNRMLNAGLGKRIGLLQSTLFNYITGLSGAIIVFFIAAEPYTAFQAPKDIAGVLIYTGGLLGMLTVIMSNFAAPRMSALLLTLLIFVSQLASGMILDFIKDGSISIWKLVGGLLVVGGVVCNQYFDRQTEKEQADCKDKIGEKNPA